MPTWLNTEMGIYETYVMTDRKLVNRTVFSSVETLIGQLRAGTLPPYPTRMSFSTRSCGKRTF
jgi:hypothetical protein